MKKIIKIFSVIMILFLSSFILFACNKDESSKISEYFYNSHGEYIAYYYENFLFDKNSNDAIAQLDKDTNVFFNNDGYFGEIYKNKYLIYNKNSNYLNTNFGYMSISPIPPIKALQPNIQEIELPHGYKDCKEIIELTLSNMGQYGIVINTKMDGWAGFYLYFNNNVHLYNSKFEIKDPITINFTLSISYVGYLKSDYTQSKVFNATISMSATSSYTKRDSIYNLNHKDYSFFEEISSSIIITSITGSLVEK